MLSHHSEKNEDGLLFVLLSLCAVLLFMFFVKIQHFDMRSHTMAIAQKDKGTLVSHYVAEPKKVV